MYIASYLRVSVKDEIEDESNSIQNQRLLVREYIEKNGLDKIENKDGNKDKVRYREYVDDGWSGAVSKRPSFEKMLEDVKRGLIYMVVVKDFSRLSRDYITLGTLVEKFFPYYKVKLISISDRYYGDNDKSLDMELCFKGIVADYYVRDVSLKTRTSLKTRKDKGIYAIPSVPFGYKKMSGQNEFTIVPSLPEAYIVQYIFGERLKGKSVKEIKYDLDINMVPTPGEFLRMRKTSCSDFSDNNKVMWQLGTLYSILKNRCYTGDMIYGKYETDMKSEKRVKRLDESKWQVVENHHQAVIDKEVYEAVQKMWY
ncbi:MAG: recombinase family protein [Lachnospira sp.]